MTLMESIAYRLRPEMKGLEPAARAGQMLNLLVSLLIIPMGTLGFIWLWRVTEPEVLRSNAGLFLVLFLLGFLFWRYPFELQLELRPGVISSSGGNLYFVVVTSAVLVFGPSAFWLGVLLSLVVSAWQIRREVSSDGKWSQMASLSANISTGIVSMLASLYAFERLGGRIPLADLTPALALPIAGFLVVYWVLPFLILAPALVFLARNEALTGAGSVGTRSLLFFLFFNASIPNLAVPFAFLGASIFSLTGTGYYLFFLFGVLFASMLANNLTNNLAERDQRARELAALEALGRDIIASDPASTDLEALLDRHVSAMFYWSRQLIFLDPDRVLFRSQATGLPGPEIIARYLPEDGARNAEIPSADLGLADARHCVVFTIEQEGGRRRGWIYFDRRADLGPIDKFFPALQSLSAQLASAMLRAETYREALAKERMENELALAGRIQANFLPESIPAIEGYRIAASLAPALQTSGDFYDFIPLPGGRLGVVVADVADKGTGAALFMALTRTLIRTYAGMHADDPAEIFRLANARVHEDTQAQLFITTFFVVIDPHNHTLTYVNGGHNPPFLCSAPNQNEIVDLVRTGIPIGMFEDGHWTSRTIPFPEDGMLVMYTDGVTEAQNEAGEFFEENRVKDMLRTGMAIDADVLHARILDAIHAFAGDAPQFDDITLVVVKRQTSERET